MARYSPHVTRTSLHVGTTPEGGPLPYGCSAALTTSGVTGEVTGLTHVGWGWGETTGPRSAATKCQVV